MSYNPADHFHARPDGHGGVTFKLRHRFKDQNAVELDDDGIARSKKDAAENGDELMRDIIFTFGPLFRGQNATLVEQEGGTIAVVVTSEPEDLIKNSTNSNAGIVGDRRTVYRTASYRRFRSA